MGEAKLFSSGLSRAKDPGKAIEELASKIHQDFQGKSCDLAVLFVSEGYEGLDAAKLAQDFKKLVSPTALIGCNSCGVIGDQNEIEMQPAISMLAMHLPSVKISPFSFSPVGLETMKSGKGLVEYLDLYPTDRPNFILLADPMSTDVNKLLSLFNESYQGSPVVGGLASGTVMNSPNWLLLGDDVFSEGAVGLALSGEIEFDIVVSQGCRPIGEPYTVTKADRNILYELAGKPALKVLTDLFLKLSVKDQRLAQNALFVGLAMDEGRLKLERGDFLIRNILATDEEVGALSIGEIIETGQTLQFQLRDAETSKEDLKVLLKKSSREGDAKKCGALLVSCCGRGKGLYGETDHDVKMIQSLRGPLMLTGFFANGELGPIDRKNYIHGYTSSLTIIR